MELLEPLLSQIVVISLHYCAPARTLSGDDEQDSELMTPLMRWGSDEDGMLAMGKLLHLSRPTCGEKKICGLSESSAFYEQVFGTENLSGYPV